MPRPTGHTVWTNWTTGKNGMHRSHGKNELGGPGSPRAPHGSGPSPRPRWRVWSAVVLSALVVVLGTTTGSATADSSGYRYWSFWVGGEQGTWSYASQGPTGLRPADGKVVGFRFAHSGSAGAPTAADSDTQPREAADFNAICPAKGEAEDEKRVALVIDPGTGRDAPAGERPPQPSTICAQLPDDASAADALAQVAAPLRYNSSGLLCAISGYPSTGCGERTSGDSDSSEATDDPDGSATAQEGDSGGTTLPLAAGLGVVALLGAGAVWQTMRRRRDS